MREQVVWERWEESLGRFLSRIEEGEGRREKGCGNSVSCLLRDWTFELSLVWSTWRRFNHGLCLTASLDQQCKRQGNRERPVMLNYSQDECVGWQGNHFLVKNGWELDSSAPPSTRKWGCGGGISEELFMFWTRKLEWILAGIWIPCQLDRVNPKLGFKCVLDSW